MKQFAYTIFLMLILLACQEKPVPVESRNAQPPILPDYAGVTIPKNIAPLYFSLPDSCRATDLYACYSSGSVQVEVAATDGQIAIDEEDWKQLLGASDVVSVQLLAEIDGRWIEYAPFTFHVAPEPIDAYLAYRLIEPGYEIWNEMGIYQRCLENFEEKAILTNQQTGYGCMNCHSFCKQDPNRMLFHLRVDYGGTYLVEDGEIEKLNTKTPQTISALVYPSWHPSGRYVAFSVNDTKQMFHTTSINRIEVMDFASDVVVYDVENHQILTTSLLSSKEAFETFPTFSPDGKTLYYCVADSVQMPLGYERARYNLCSIPFNPENRSFGTAIDTLLCASDENATISFPRVSPDGRFLMFTQADYGNFTIWHKEADLHLLDLETKQTKPLDALNSDETESYHMWSSNGRWVVFSSRRLDGLYTRPFIAYMDEEGNAHKPFLLPQKSRDYYTSLMKSYNVPEFITGEVEVSGYQLSQVAKQSAGIDVSAVAR